MCALSILCFVLCIVYFAVGLWPLGIAGFVGGLIFFGKWGNKQSTPSKTNQEKKPAVQKADASSSVQKSASTPKNAPKKQSAPKKVPGISYNQRNILVPGAPAVDAYSYSGSQADYFQRLLTNAFPGYTLRCNVPVEHLYEEPVTTDLADGRWRCECGMINATNFCGDCGKHRPASPATPSAKFAPVSFLLCQNGQPKLALMLGGRFDKDSPSYKKTISRLNSSKIPVQYYINTFRNKASYVYSRVSDSL